jgi:hypothetical protein
VASTNLSTFKLSNNHIRCLHFSCSLFHLTSLISNHYLCSLLSITSISNRYAYSLPPDSKSCTHSRENPPNIHLVPTEKLETTSRRSTSIYAGTAPEITSRVAACKRSRKSPCKRARKDSQRDLRMHCSESVLNLMSNKIPPVD